MNKLSFLFILALLVAACNNTTTTDQTTTENTETIAVEGVLEIAIINVSGMSCEGCEKTIATALSDLDGVEDARVSLEYEQAKVKFEPAKVSIDDLKAAIESKGYGVEEIEVVTMEDQLVEPAE